ncbi:glycosyltransferase family 4 protein [Pseudoalteromonas sp. JC3]|uniref:glycosyltransferase family 4 protein n=1 Tax=Pseudoalteromonas sp. JC3 TaxID=2810196 RepID=UPI0019D0F33E|nr:glycosyltransferase family 4 protein [Pseudoalteromonas sp. JC3]MBR8842455.1 glycosyltransferase family 4 protein [Pseudoalteromonas sp. JC3]WJE09426.1 glycosyltransferase family 4 protein [Pseudoalteromonas sp. JC3]
MDYKVVHLTTAHPRYDTRIFVKMCCSLAKENYDVSLIVADGKGDEINSSVNIIDVGSATGNRILRMTKTVERAFKQALLLDADLYHLHDPELLQVASKLKKNGKKVIFDAHEDLPVQILSKPYLNPVVAKGVSVLARFYEKWVCSRIDGVIAATPFIRDKFSKINANTIDVNNFPRLEEFSEEPSRDFTNRKSCCYIGGITKVRGIIENVQALEHVNDGIELLLAGSFLEKNIRANVTELNGWAKVKELGFLNRNGVRSVLQQSFVGLVTLHPIRNYQDALPVKMFEYMASGIPVIYTDIEYWRSIVEPEACGIAVDPFDLKAVANAINDLAENLELAKEMGSRGRKAVLEKYNWSVEVKKLIDFYKDVLS